MYNASDLRKNLKIQIDGDPYVIVEFTFSKTGARDNHSIDVN